ncbi:acetyl-CoA carboxylase family protein [Sphingomonas corticis]|uniref:ATP-grasp domain-containing protein n=1 Tax=Sphingomonas corticis TaxID=2722791 RepID=A0ABX1CQA9_9SPHN|nr:carboxyl transferase domain-containing protein [Sphingomonas corticis]NJR79016.1 ATP-grasp domain-containing protein [Sphingomonas corticis]
MPGLLIANRGEIAIRIARTARAMGIATAAVYAGDDAAAPHVAAADAAHPLPGEGPAAYLSIEALIAAARAGGCDGVHPGYGFLSESPAFARACADAGLRFVGPDAAALALFGDKAAAKALAREAGVPVLAEGTAALAEGAVLVKATAGGGGRGIRIVDAAADLPAAVSAARAEAAAAFGAGEVIVERYVPRGRHIEVQLAGDAHGGVVALGTRDCSIQRRYQKFVEVAPAPGLSPVLEEAIVAAAIRLLAARPYVGLATAEFLVDLDRGDFAFLEVNPRLQVEHTVTEEVTGLDLVGLQLRLAAGGRVPAPPVTRGVAIELRVGTETPGAGGTVRPSTGTIRGWRAPGGPGIRVDAAVATGMAVNPRFDPLLLKIVARGADAEEALARAQTAVAECEVTGVATNLPVLAAVLARADVVGGTVTTGWFDAIAEEFATPAQAGEAEASGALAPLSGVVVAIDAAVGQRVARGAELATIEALKMRHAVVAPRAGVVRAVAATVGGVVAEGEPIVLLDPAEEDSGDEPSTLPPDPALIRADLAEVIAAHAHGRDEHRADAVARRHAGGRRTARENIADLFDDGSFVEYGALAVAAQRRRRDLADLIAQTPHDGLVGGVGTVNAERVGEEAGRCLGLAYDYTVLAGTQGLWNHRKTDRLLAVAEAQRLPVVFYTEGGGGRPGDVDALGVSGLDTPTFRSFAALSGKAPRIAVTTGFCFAGNAVLFGCADITIATEGSHIGMGGPAMIEGGGLGVHAPTAIGPLDVQWGNGVVDLRVADEAAATAAAKELLGFFQGRLRAGEAPDQRRLRHVVPEDRLRVFDIRAVVAGLVDADSFVELRGGFAPGMVTGLARVDGRAIGLLANDCRHLSGAIDSDGADKAARFLQLCDAFGVPVVSLIDTPGFMVGPDAERTAPVRHGSRMFLVAAQLSVPIFAVVIRKAYGLGAQAMAGGSLQTSAFTVAWPTGEFGGMGLEGAVRLGYRRELDAIVDPVAREARYRELVAASYDRGKAVGVARVLEIDAVIDPAETRTWLRRGLASATPRASGRFVDSW